MSSTRAALALLGLLYAGCASPTSAPHTAAAPQQRAARAPVNPNVQLAQNVLQLELLLNQARDLEALDSLRIVGMDDGPVPGFKLRAPGGVEYDSEALLGKEPFLAIFFATWCDYCQVEMKTVQRAVQQSGPMLVIPVSVDGPETWAKVPGYLASFGITAQAVRAVEYPRFAAAYNPFDTLPVVVVVGRNGGLVDYLMGYDPANAERLVASLRLAKTIGPLAKPELNARND